MATAATTSPTAPTRSWPTPVSLVTKAKYVASTTEQWTGIAGTPFPVTDTDTIDSKLVGLADTDNFLAHTTLHTTVSATGVPTATADQVVSSLGRCG